MWGLGMPSSPDAIQQITEMRNASGVHVYLDNSDSRRGQQYQLLNDTLKNTWNFKYTALLMATRDNPSFGLIVSNTDETRLIEMGIGGNFYFYVWFCDNRRCETQVDTTKLLKLKDGEYMLVSWDLFTLFNREKQLEPYVNGKRVFENADFHFEGENLEKFGNTLTHHKKHFDNIVITEHHFLYTDITENLKKSGSQDYISFQYSILCVFSAGGYAKIRGKYKNMNANIKGILIGFARPGVKKTLTFDYLDPQKEVDFQVTTGEFLTYISSADKFCVYENRMPPGYFIWLLVQNIDIKNIEIHTGRSIRF